MTGAFITIKTSELTRIIAQAAQFAGTDDALPMLSAVRVEIIDGWLIATATDRYALAQSRVEIDAEANMLTGATFNGVEAVMTLRDAHRLLRVFRAQRGSDPLLTFEIGSGRIDIKDKWGTQILILTFTGTVPDWRQLFAGFTPAPAATISVNPRYLLKIVRAAGKNEPTRMLFHGENKGILYQIGEHFRVIVMPVRPQDDFTEPSWPA